MGTVLIIVILLCIIGLVGRLIQLVLWAFSKLLGGVVIGIAVLIYIHVFTTKYQEVKKDPTNPEYYGTIYRLIVPECNEYWSTVEYGDRYEQDRTLCDN